MAPAPTESHNASYEQRIVPAREPQQALNVSAVYRATELRAKTIGQMPVQYQRRDSEKGNFMPWMMGLGKRMNYLLQEEPNPIMTAASLWEQVTINRLQLGNGFVYIERDVFGDPIHLWLAICGGYNMVEGTYNITYLSDNGIVNVAAAPRQNVLHFPNTFRYYNGFWGIPTLRYAYETLSLIRTQKSQALETAAKGGRVKMLIQEKDSNPQGTRGRANQNELRRITRQFNEDWVTGDAIFLNNVADAKPISLTGAEMQMIEQMNLGLDDVARFWGTPRPLLMLDTNSHYNDYSNATMEYLSRTIGPDKTDMEKEIFRKLLGMQYYGQRRIHICEKPLLAMDPERQAKVDQLNLQTGVKTVNELRAEHDMPSVPEGSIPYVSTNLAELGSEKLRSNGGGRPSNNNNENDNENENGKGNAQGA